MCYRHNMRLRNLFCLGVLTFVIIGCEPSPEEQKIKTSESLNAPEFVGKLPNGRIIERVWIHNRIDKHAVYFFANGGQEITVNYPVQVGKTTRNEVIVLLDGIPVSTNIINK